jgi:AcrR family transcriptional regulator
MADIIAASGLMRSTIYQYFSNKDELIWALVQEIMEHSNALRQQILHDPPGSALH